jgi:zinc transporter
MSALEGVLHGREVDRDGVVRRMGLAGLGPNEGGWRLICLGRDSLEARSWLIERSGLTHSVVGALIAEDTRPRAVVGEDGALVIMRGAVRGPDGRFDDMVSVRLFVTEDRIIAVQRRALPTFEQRVEALDRGECAAGVGAFVVGLAEALRADAEPISTAFRKLWTVSSLTRWTSPRRWAHASARA